MTELTLDSHAKINLALLIKGKFPDGYHQLETILQRIGLKDTITIKSKATGIGITSNSEKMPLDETNLAYRAAEKIIQRAGIDKGVDIHIDKTIPMGAGLGGGSSNAGTVLRGLNNMWDLGFERADLCAMAGELGADVPFFVDDNCALGTGRGDLLKPIENRCKFWVLVVYPGVSISTAWVYSQFTNKLTNKGNYIKILKLYLQKNKPEKISENLVNDLETVVFPAFPEIKEIKDQLLEEGASGALMSGSGSAVFGLFGNRSETEKTLEKLRGKNNSVMYVADFII